MIIKTIIENNLFEFCNRNNSISAKLQFFASHNLCVRNYRNFWGIVRTGYLIRTRIIRRTYYSMDKKHLIYRVPIVLLHIMRL